MQYMTRKESTVRKCYNICKQIYDPEQLGESVLRREVLNLLSPQSTLVDIGCGHRAMLLRFFSSYVKKAYGIDLEISETIVDGNVQIMYGNAEAIPLPDHSADVVTMYYVVEHLRDPNQVFLECKRILKPGGSLVLIVPCKFYPPILLGHLLPHHIRQWAIAIVTGTKREHVFPAYYRANSRSALCRLGSSVGMRVISIRYLTHHPAYFMLSVFVYRCAVAIERFVLQREAFRYLRHQIFCHLRTSVEMDSE